MSEVIVDFDNSWKQGLEDFFAEFLELLFPEVYDLIDWTKPVESKEQELQQVIREADSGKRYTDKLFKVYLKNKQEVWILIHTEVQSQKDDEFAKRMWIYHYRLSDRYQKKIINLAVLADSNKDWRPSSYTYSFGGCELSFKFPMVKLIDFEDPKKWKKLEKSNNPFALFVMAHLRTLSTYHKLDQRKAWKWTLVRKLFEKGYSREEITKLFRVIDWLMALPEDLEQAWLTDVMEYQKEGKMPLLSHLEIRAKEEGVQQGRQEGVQQGRQEGVQQGRQEGQVQVLQENITDILETRFGSLSGELENTIASLNDIPRLKQLFKQALAIASVEEFQQLLED